jgi:hypothetical protein
MTSMLNSPATIDPGKDVHEVTSVDPQMIIMDLLHNEYYCILHTRGSVQLHIWTQS